MIFWLFLKVSLLYGISFLFSIFIYFYLNGRLLPPHRTLQFPLNWREGEIAVVELENDQRYGGNFYLKGNFDIETRNFPVIQSNVPYDISLLLKYPDRPEIADLGNLRVSLKLLRKDGKEAGKLETFRALRYESKILRNFREILSLPIAIWKDSGSERIERISLIKRLIDESNLRKDGDFGFDLKRKNPIDRLEISINPLPPLHSVQLEILVNLSPLQHFLFYWRIPAAVLIIGGVTCVLWLLSEPELEPEFIDLSEIEELNQVLKEADDASEPSDATDIRDMGDDNIIVSVQFPPAESVANFIGDLRQRKLKAKDEDDAISIYNSDAEDQSVPIEKEE